jgi:lysine/ornithine N-monooxygenase
MEINIEKKISPSEISDEDKKIHYFIYEYLEKSYKIKKQGTVYLLKNKTSKIIIDESTIQKMYKLSYINTNVNNAFFARFLVKSLRNKWTIEKKQKNYIFTKKHHGKKEYFSSNYLTGFMENNF